jgi:hemoglobin-like flavoprotein
MISKREIVLIKKSWAIFKKIDTAVVGDMFYRKLFFENPELRKMFPQNMEDQYRKLFDMLNTIVARLEKLDELKGDIVAMAKRHTDYGVKPEHYNMVGIALLYTLQKSLADEWGEEVRSAWINCYAILSGTMITVSGK